MRKRGRKGPLDKWGNKQDERKDTVLVQKDHKN